MIKDTIGDLEKSYDKVWRQGLFINMRDAVIVRLIPLLKKNKSKSAPSSYMAI